MPYDPFLTLEQNGIKRLQQLQADNPDIFNEQQTAQIGHMVAGAGMPLPRQEEGDFSVGEMFTQFGQGFIQGFTTLEVGEDPDNDYEYVARNLGHLLGFIGVVPGVGSVGKIGATALIKSATWIGRGLQGVRAGGMATRLANLELLGQVPKLLKMKSVPMYAADKLMESKIGANLFKGVREGLGNIKMLEKVMAENGVGTSMLRKGVHLGLASAVSAAPIYRLDLEERLQALTHGFEAGLVFGGIGNLIGKGGIVGSSAKRILADGSEREALANVVARSAASALYMGLPSTLRGDPTPIQVYDWVSGAIFGVMEKPSYMVEAGQFWHKNLRQPGGQNMLMRPEKLEGWDGLSEYAKEEVKHWSDLYLGRKEAVGGWTNVGRAIGLSAKDALEKLHREHRIDDHTMEEIIEGERLSVEYALEEQNVKDRGVSDPSEVHNAAMEGLRDRMYERGIAQKELYEQFIKEAEEGKLASERARNDLLARDMQTVMNAFDEEHVSLRFHEPMSELAAALETHTKGGPEAKSLGELEVELVREISAFKKAKMRLSQADLQEFIGKVESKYSRDDAPFTIERGSELFGKLSTAWMRIAQDRPYMSMVVQLDANGVPRVTMMPDIVDGKPTSADAKAKSFMAMALYPEKDGKYRSSGIIEVGQVLVKDPKTGRETLKDITEVPGINFSHVISDMYFRKNTKGNDMPLMFLGGKKDTGVRLFGRPLAWPVVENGEVVYRYLDPVSGKRTKISLEDKLALMQEAANRAAGEGGTAENVVETYRQLKEDFKADFRDEAGRYTHTPEHKVEAMFDHHYMNSIVVVERLNAGVPVERMIASGDKFIMNAANWNKRLQVYHSPDYYMTPETFRGLPDLVGEGSLPGIIVRVDKSKEGMERAQFTAYKMGKDGFAEEYVVETHLDGVMFMRSDYFDRMAESMGAPTIGGAKLTITFAEPGKGAFMGKLLVHRATPDLDAHLKAHNWSFKIYDTAAKQQGLREDFVESWNAEKGDIEYFNSKGQKLGENVGLTTDKAPVSSGTMRLYRGESAGQNANGDWWTTNIEKAQKFAGKDGKILYVDVSQTKEDLIRFAQGHGGADEYYTNDAEFKKRAKELPAKQPTAGASKEATQPPPVTTAPTTVELSGDRPAILSNRENMIEYTSGQEAALTQLSSIIRDRVYGKSFVLAGYAGTGKTTIIENIVRTALKTKTPAGLSATVHVVAPTNKAVRVLASKLPADLRDPKSDVMVRTIYNLLYDAPEVDPITGELAFVNEEGNKGKAVVGDWVIVDESSMVNKQVYQDTVALIKEVGANVIWIGDTFQLRPVEGSGRSSFSVLSEPNTELTEVRRQGLQSNILKLATAMRTMGRTAILPDKSEGDVEVKTENDVKKDFLASIKAGEDAVFIATTNEERVAANAGARQHVHGVTLTADYIPGEPLIAINNSRRLANGELFKVTDPKKLAGARRVTLKTNSGEEVSGQFMYTGFTHTLYGPKADAIFIVPDYAKPGLAASMFNVDSVESAGLGEFVVRLPDGRVFMDKGFGVATYGYSMTGHKSQGSQWERVFIAGKSRTMVKDPRWLYTAITRASRTLTMSSEMPTATMDWKMIEQTALEGSQKKGTTTVKPTAEPEVSESASVDELMALARGESRPPEANDAPPPSEEFTGTVQPEAPAPMEIPLTETKPPSVDVPPPATVPPAAAAPPPSEDYRTLIPAEGLRLNLSASEHPSLDDVQSKIQFSGQLNQTLGRLWVNRMISQAWRGDPETMRVYGKYRLAKTDAEREALAMVIDPKKLGAQEIYDVLQGREMREGPLFDKVARHVLAVKESDFTELTDIVDPSDKLEAMQDAASRSVAMTIMEAGPLTPLTIEMRQLRGFLDTRMRKYFRDRVVKPYLPGSWSSKSYALDLFLQHKTGLKAGEYMAAEGLREKEIQVGKHYTTLGKAWEQLTKLEADGKQETAKYKELEEAMEHFVIRVPADSASGIRVLKFKGFISGAKGFGVYLTPEDMSYLGGMDQDGDSVDVYTRVPDRELHTAMKDYFRSKAKQWHHKVQTKDGKEVDVFDESDPSRFLVEPTGTPEEKAQRKSMLNSFAGMFSPKTQTMFHESSTRALRMLGPSLLHARRLLDIVRTAHASNNGIIEWQMGFYESLRMKLDGQIPGMDRLKPKEQEEYRRLGEMRLSRAPMADEAKNRFYELDRKTRTQDFRIRGTAVSEREAERVLRDVVNTMADASKGYILKSRDEIMDALTRSVMPDVKVYFKVGAKGNFEYDADARRKQMRWIGGYEESAEFPFRLNARSHPVYRAMLNVDGIMRGRDLEGRRVPFEEVITRMRNVEQAEVLKNAGHTWYLGALHLGRLQLNKVPMAGYNTLGMQKMIEATVKLANADPRLAAYALHHHLSLPSSGLENAIAKMEKEGLTPEAKATRINQLVFNDVYSAVTAIKLMQSGKRFVEDMVTSGKMIESDARKELLKISELAERLKEQDAVLFKNDQAFEDLGFKITDSREAKKLKAEAFETYQKLPDAGKEYFAYRLLGTLFHQDAPYLAKITPLKEKVEDLKKRHAASERAGDGNDASLLFELTQARGELAAAEKAYYHTGMSRLAYSWDFIHPSYVRSMLSTAKELLGTIDGETVDGRKLARAVSGTLKLDGISSLAKEVLPDAADEVSIQYKIREYHETFMKEITQGGGSVEGIDPATRVLLDKFKDFLYHYPHMLKVLPSLWEGTLSKMYAGQERVGNIRGATKKQFKAFLRNFMYHGKFWHELSGEERKLALARRHFLFDPENLGANLRPFDNSVMATYRAPVELPDGSLVFKEVRQVLSTFDTITETWGAMHFSINGILNEQRKELEEGWKEYEGGLQIVRSLGEDGERIFGYVSDIRQRRLQHAIDAQRNFHLAKGEDVPDARYNYEAAADAAEAEFRAKYENGNKRLTYTNNKGQQVTETALQIHARILELQTAWAKRVAKFLKNESLEKKYIKTREETGEVDVRATLNEFAKVIRLGGNMPFIGMNGLYRVYHQMLIERLYVKDYTDPNGIRYDRILYRDIRDAEHRRRELQKLKDSQINADGWMEYKPVEPFAADFYFPHNGHPREMIERMVKERFLQKVKSGDIAGAIDSEIGLKSSATQANDETGGWGDTLDALESDTVEEQGIRAADLFKIIPTPAHHRGMEPLPGWDKSSEALVRYEQQMIRGYHKMLGSLMSHSAIADFKSARVMGEHTDAWAVNMRLYNRDNMGYPSTFRKEWLEDPKYMIRNNALYYPLTDQFMLDRMKQISKKYKLSAVLSDKQQKIKASIHDAKVRRLMANARQDEAEAARLDSEIKAKEKQIEDLFKDALDQNLYGTEEEMYRKVRVLANLEAKWEMISLLSHTKTMANNLFDGSINTAVSAGLDHFYRAGDFNHLKTNVFTGEQFRNLHDIQRWAEEHGAGESYIVDVFEAGSSGKQGSLGEFIRDTAKTVTGNKPKDGLSFEQRLERNTAVKKVMDAGAFAMRFSERKLRSRAWLAHYLKAREVLGANAMTFKFDDPWLISMANRGVAGTQFLYNNAARPAFARTMLGRVFTRFQMYAMKSTKMRMDILKEAAAMGWDEGTEAYQKLQRRMVADLFMIGLASMFPASMFSSTLGGPLAQMKEIATFFFGDDKDKERAFFSPLPYPASMIQVVSPPIMRVPYATFGTMLTGDWDKFWGQHVWTWFPFGRIARDVKGVVEKPALASEKFLGLPFHQMQRRAAKKDSEKKRRRLEAPIMGAIW